MFTKNLRILKKAQFLLKNGKKVLDKSGLHSYNMNVLFELPV